MKRFLSVVLCLTLFLALIPCSPRVTAAGEDLLTIVERQVKAYAKSIDQKDAATTAATALLTNAAFLGKDLTFDKSSATTAMIFNSYMFQDGLSRSLTELSLLMQRLSATSLSCYANCVWRVESAAYTWGAYKTGSHAREDRLHVLSTTYWMEDPSYLLENYNANDRMLISVTGDLNIYYTLTVISQDEDSILYNVDLVARDDFNYDADYSEAQGNMDYEELLKMFGALTLKDFHWESHLSFQLEVPYACDHEIGSYRWIYNAEQDALLCDTSGQYLSNAATKQSIYTNHEDGEMLRRYYCLDDQIQLRHDRAWMVEYDIQGGRSLMLSPCNDTTNAMLLLFQHSRYNTYIGYTRTTNENGSNSHYYGNIYTDAFRATSTHIMRYRLENAVNADGSNTIWLTVTDLDLGDVVYGPVAMDNYYTQKHNSRQVVLQETGSTWLSGKDIIVNFFGNYNTPFNSKVSSIAIYENGVNGENGSAFEETVVAPTCAAEGYTRHTCSKCHYSYKTDFTDKLEHAYVEKIVAPTCTAEGYTLNTCTMCGGNYKSDIIEKLPHDVTEYASNKDATCAHDGTKTGKCTVCGEKVTVADEGTALPHTWVDATCEKAKTCKFCGATEGDALGHDLKHYNAKAPTCENVGWDAYEKCLRCSYSTFARLPALGHEHVNGVCTRCGDRDGSIVPGEVSGDGKIDMLDVYQIILHLSGKFALDEVQLAAADVNGDGTVNLPDIYQIMLLYREEST